MTHAPPCNLYPPRWVKPPSLRSTVREEHCSYPVSSFADDGIRGSTQYPHLYRIAASLSFHSHAVACMHAMDDVRGRKTKGRTYVREVNCSWCETDNVAITAASTSRWIPWKGRNRDVYPLNPAVFATLRESPPPSGLELFFRLWTSASTSRRLCESQTASNTNMY